MKCRLCLQEKKLQNSHIIPEFFYKPLYDGLHRINVLSTSPEEKTKYIQKGIREKLLCYDCEQGLSPLEDYGRRILYGPDVFPTEEQAHLMIIRDIDYARFKLFQLSLLWRASIAKNQAFSAVNIGPNHEDRLRQMLYAKNPGEAHECGCVPLLYAIGDDKPMAELIGPFSFFRRINSHRCYKFVLGGCLWIYVVSSHSRSFRVREWFFSEDGKLTVLKHKAKNDEELRRLLGI